MFFCCFGVLFFWYFWFWVFGLLRDKGCCVVLGFCNTAMPLSVIVDSDVVEEAYLNCQKRSGRV